MRKTIPIHPGEILKEEFLVPLGLSANKLAKAIGVPANRVSEIINGDRGITGDTALRFAAAFGTTPEFWMNLQSQYQLELAEMENGAAIHKQIKRLIVVDEDGETACAGIETAGSR